MGWKLKPTHGVLALLCVMYFITYIDRVNIGTAASAIKSDLGLSHTQMGVIFSAFGYPYLLFQVGGGWIGDNFGPRKTLFWCGMIWAIATILTGFVTGIITLFLARILLGFGEGATFPSATCAMQHWTPFGKRGFAQGLTHAFSRIGNAVTPPLVAALVTYYSWRGSFILLGFASLIWGLIWVVYYRNEPKKHPDITEEELKILPTPREGPRPQAPWGALIRRMWPVTLTYFCYAWCLWLYLNWLPSFFKENYQLDLMKSAFFASGVFILGAIGDTVGGLLSDRILHATGNVRLARLSIVLVGFFGALLSLLPIIFVHDITIVAICLACGFFFAELVIGPMWSIPMDIAPKFSGTAAGLMNSGSAFALIVSPLAGGVMIDMTGNWYLPFIMTILLMLIGMAAAFLMHPEKPLEMDEPLSPLAGGTPLEAAL
ncbi:MFS transporter [Methyloferula stellata]|uniref:MFS transporter n=1 Tax=Methyloferula stellata TaxID=876270 RepID=UPI00047D7438|nr:MFS transporter [Methyloferula stellata]